MPARGPWTAAATAASALLVLFSVWLVAIDRSRRVERVEVQGWNLFHYGVGAAFFPELGYRDLYEATLAADEAGDRSLAHVQQVRDLGTATYRRRADLPPPRWDAETLARLDAWQNALEPYEGQATWRDMLRDRGYNGSPAYTALVGPFVRAFPPTEAGNVLVWTAVDPLLLLVAALAVASTRGPARAALSSLAFVAFPGVWRRQVGGLVEYDWLAAVALGLCFTASGRPAPAAIALAWATAARVFPAALVGTLLLPGALRAARGRGWPAFDRVFVASFAGALAAFVLLGCTAGRGASAWVEFADRIRLHAARHPLGEQRVGLAHLWTAFGDPTGSEAAQQELLAARAPLPTLSGVVLAAGAAVAALRRTRAEAATLGLLVVFALTTASRYYAAAFLLWPVFAVRGRWTWAWVFALPPLAWALRGWEPRPTWWALEAVIGGGAAARAVGWLAWDAAVVRRSLRRRRGAAGAGRGEVDHR